MQERTLSEALASRERVHREMIEDHAQALRRYCVELVRLIDSGEYVREAADMCWLDRCKSTDALANIYSEKQRRTMLVNGMEMATGKRRMRQ